MAYYTVLPRPEGTDAYDKGIGYQLVEEGSKAIGQALGKKREANFKEEMQKQGYEPSYNIGANGKVSTNYKKPKAEKEPSRTESIEADMAKANSGEMTWDEVIAKYPLEADKIRTAKYASKYNKQTRETIEDIGGQKDAFDMFIKSEDDFRAAGVDVDAVKEHYKDLAESKKKKKFDWTPFVNPGAGAANAMKGLFNG